MTDKTIAELREWKKQYDIFPSMAADEEFLEILSRAEAVEPLEELAKRKGEAMTVEFVRRGWAPNMRMSTEDARAYLESLPDGERGRK